MATELVRAAAALDPAKFPTEGQYKFFRDGATSGRGLEPSVLQSQLLAADEIEPRERQRKAG